MVASSTLDKHVNTNLQHGIAHADDTSRNFIISGKPEDVTSIIAVGNNLLLTVAGKSVIITGFSRHGSHFNNLIFDDSGTRKLVTLNEEFSWTGYKNLAGRFTVEPIVESLSAETLAGILGATAAGIVVVGANDDDADRAVNLASPAITAVVDDNGTIAHGGGTADTTLTISGTAESGATVEISANGTVLGSVVADANGVWSFDYTDTPLARGRYEFSAIAINSAGNHSEPSGEYDVFVDARMGTESYDTLDYGESDENEGIFGLAGMDTIAGGNGDDWISGGVGSDYLTGGSGSDTFYYVEGDEDGNDVILDFTTGEGGDVIDLSDLVDSSVVGSQPLSAWIEAVDDNGFTVLQIDPDGAGSRSSFTIMLSSVTYTNTVLNDLISNGNIVYA